MVPKLARAALERWQRARQQSVSARAGRRSVLDRGNSRYFLGGRQSAASTRSAVALPGNRGITGRRSWIGRPATDDRKACTLDAPVDDTDDGALAPIRRSPPHAIRAERARQPRLRTARHLGLTAAAIGATRGRPRRRRPAGGHADRAAPLERYRPARQASASRATAGAAAPRTTAAARLAGRIHACRPLLPCGSARVRAIRTACHSPRHPPASSRGDLSALQPSA